MIIPHPSHQNKGFHMDDTLHANVVEIRRRIGMDKDALILGCGDPGNGKSTIINQVMYVCDPEIISSRCIHSTVEDYRRYALSLAEKNMSKGRANIHDEARETGGMNVVSKRIRKHWDFIYENRFLNMYQAQLESDFWNVPRHVIYHRALFMLWVIEEEDWSNGVFLFYNKKDMRRLYERGKRLGERSPKGYTFRGRFVKFWAGNPDYLKIKHDNFMSKYREKKEDAAGISLKDAQLLAMSRNPDRFNAPLFARVYHCDVSQVYKYMKEWEMGRLE